MFNDGRSKKLVFVAHCILNQNSISDGTAVFPGCDETVLELLRSSAVGIVQMPCPELHCLGLDRGDLRGGAKPVLEENTRIRNLLCQDSETEKIYALIEHVLIQILEYRKHGLEIMGIIGIDRSPSCGVNTSSKENKEVAGEGVFIEALDKELEKHNIPVKFVGIKAAEPDKAIITVKNLLANGL